MNIKRILVFLLLILTQYTVFSQADESSKKEESKKSEFWNKVRFGGGINIGFSDRSTNIGVSPSAIYQFNDKVAAGMSVSFGYSSFERNDAKQFNYGTSAIFLYNPFRELQLSAELEQTFVNSSFKIAGQKSTRDFNFPAFYVGAGYRLGNLTTGFRYDILFNQNRNIYSSAFSPFVRVFF